jgi:hypothetical protein
MSIEGDDGQRNRINRGLWRDYLDQTTLYVDIENLQDIAQQTLKSAFEIWPPENPRIGTLKLYVRADQVGLWRIWTSYQFPTIETVVKGVQHYTVTGSKNSADIALALDAITDLLKGKTQYLAIMSDDSDFATLFAAIKQETNPTGNQKVPFKWFMTNRSDTRSPMLTDFFPAEYIQTIGCALPNAIPKEPDLKRSKPATDQRSPSAKITEQPSAESNSSEAETIAKAIIKNTPVGPFKSADCKKIITRDFPNNTLTKVNSAAFGTQFAKDIWPILEKYGVQLPNPNKKPRKYEMTQEAKNKAE